VDVGTLEVTSLLAGLDVIVDKTLVSEVDMLDSELLEDVM